MLNPTAAPIRELADSFSCYFTLYRHSTFGGRPSLWFKKILCWLKSQTFCAPTSVTNYLVTVFFFFFFHGTVLVVSNWVSQSHLPPLALLHEQIVMKFCGQIGIGPQNEMNKEPGGGPGLKLAPSRKWTLYCCVREEERAKVRRIQLLARELPRIFFPFFRQGSFLSLVFIETFGLRCLTWRRHLLRSAVPENSKPQSYFRLSC